MPNATSEKHSLTKPVKMHIGIEITNGAMQYLHAETAVLNNINMHFPAQKWTCILGKSGCGKTSLLRYLAGLLTNEITWQGELHISSNMSEHISELSQHIAYMAQQDLLLPWLSVIDNVLLNEKFTPQFTSNVASKKISQDQIDKAYALLEQVGLADNANDRPQQLSGGMRQRVALARTLMQDKPVVLMDEPFSALDAVTRYRLQDLACSLLKDKTVVLITHDPQEAIRLAEQIYILQGSPAHANKLNVPSSPIPRQFDAETACLQQAIMTSLEQEYV